MCKLSVVVLAGVAMAGVAWAAPPPLEPLTYLVGEWHATGTGQPGVGTGTASFSWELQGRVLVRRSFAEYPASAGRPASRHDDLMIVYPEAGAVRAEYYDSEGHVIRYAVTLPATGQSVFVSDVRSGEPRFRLTYRLVGGVLKGEFEIAPPGTPEAFKPYLTWDSTKAALR